MWCERTKWLGDNLQAIFVARSDLPSRLDRTHVFTWYCARAGCFCVRAANPRKRFDGFCTKFGLNHVQKAEPIDALCTKFDLNHVQKAENNTRNTK
ncbi:hypothetical protein CG392_06015 [Gardnerella vaginalis]|nr:hypothetical protein CG392_06015 [Gardnerella vaginalis]